MKLIKLFIIFSLVLFSILSCSREPWGPLLENRINTRNPKYRIELKRWDSFMAFGSGSSRLNVYKSGSKRRIAGLSGGGRFSQVYWKDMDNLVVIDFEGPRSSQKCGVQEFKYGKLTITNYCFKEIGGRWLNTKSDSISFENELLTFYNTELYRDFKLLISVPIDQYLFSYKIDGNIVKFKIILDELAEPISDYNVGTDLWRIELNDSNITKLKNIMSKME